VGGSAPINLLTKLSLRLFDAFQSPLIDALEKALEQAECENITCRNVEHVRSETAKLIFR
jgi:hypothetical protein